MFSVRRCAARREVSKYCHNTKLKTLCTIDEMHSCEENLFPELYQLSIRVDPIL